MVKPMFNMCLATDGTNPQLKKIFTAGNVMPILLKLNANLWNIMWGLHYTEQDMLMKLTTSKHIT
jgi:hypothetical protein